MAQRGDSTSALIGGARATIGQGAMMGWGDEAEAWLRSKLGQGEYEDLVRKIRGEYSQFAEKHPVVSTVSEFGGGVLPGIAAMLLPGGTPTGAAQVGAATTSALSRLAARPIVRTSAAGAGSGAVTGAGTADEESRLSGGIAGGVMGGALGAAVPVAMRSAGGVREWLADRLFPSAEKATSRAAGKMTEAMGESGITPRDILRRMERDEKLGVPSTVANIDPALADLAETVAQRTGAGTRQVEKVIGRQQEGAKERTYQQLRKSLNPKDFYGEEERLLSDLRTKSAPAYKAAYAVGEVDDPVIGEMMKMPQLKSAWETARQIAEAEAAAAKAAAARSGQPFDPSEFKLRDIYDFVRDPDTGNITGWQVTGQAPDVRTLDYMKRALDAQINAGYRSDNAATLASAHAMKQLRDTLRDRTKEVVPEYAQALQIYKGDREVLDALRAGYDEFGKLDHEEVIKLVGALSPTEKEAYRTGVVRGLYGKFFNSGRNMNAAAMLDAPEMQAKLQPLFDSSSHYDLFKAAVERESQLFKQANKILAGSQTGKRKVMQEKFESGDDLTQAAAQAVTGGWASSLTGLASRALYKTTMTEEMAEKLAGMLMSKDPKEVAAVVKVLEDYADRAAPKAAAANVREMGAATGSAISAIPTQSAERGEADIESELSGPAVLELLNGPDIEADLESETRTPR